MNNVLFKEETAVSHLTVKLVRLNCLINLCITEGGICRPLIYIIL